MWLVERGGMGRLHIGLGPRCSFSMVGDVWRLGLGPFVLMYVFGRWGLSLQ